MNPKLQSLCLPKDDNGKIDPTSGYTTEFRVHFCNHRQPIQNDRLQAAKAMLCSLFNKDNYSIIHECLEGGMSMMIYGTKSKKILIVVAVYLTFC